MDSKKLAKNIVPLVAIGATLYFLPDARGSSGGYSPNPKKASDVYLYKYKVNCGPYGFRSGMTKGMLQVAFPGEHLQSNEWYKRDQTYEDMRIPERIVPLNVVLDLYTTHPYINWRPSYLKGVKKSLQAYKYGHFFKDERQLVEYIMAQATIGNTDKWHGKGNITYGDYPVDYSNDTLDRGPTASMILEIL